MNRSRLSVWCVLLSCAVRTLSGAVTWDRTEFEASPGPDDERVEASYPFTNAGTSAITIGNIETSCGCTAASLAKRRYEPGESGQVSVVFSIGDRTGKQDKRVRVPIVEDGGDPRIVELTLRADIHAAAVLDRRLMRWDIGGEATPQTATFTVIQPTPVHLVGVDGYDHDDFHVAIEAVADGRVYRVTVTPTSVAGSRDTSIFLRTDAGGGRARDYRIWLVIH